MEIHNLWQNTIEIILHKVSAYYKIEGIIGSEYDIKLPNGVSLIAGVLKEGRSSFLITVLHIGIIGMTQFPGYAISTPLLSLQAAVSNAHWDEYVLPSVPQTGPTKIGFK